jgi:hypothetical protein
VPFGIAGREGAVGGRAAVAALVPEEVVGGHVRGMDVGGAREDAARGELAQAVREAVRVQVVEERLLLGVEDDPGLARVVRRRVGLGRGRRRRRRHRDHGLGLAGLAVRVRDAQRERIHARGQRHPADARAGREGLLDRRPGGVGRSDADVELPLVGVARVDDPEAVVDRLPGPAGRVVQ